MTQDAAAARRFGLHRVELLHRHELQIYRVGVIGSGGNSGFQALNLAVQFGAKRIVLVGYDMRVDAGLHWHGAHPHGLNNPSAGSVMRWAATLDAQAPLLKRLGVEVLNASPVSALKAYPKVRLEDVLDG